jgi:hypothetical protein
VMYANSFFQPISLSMPAMFSHPESEYGRSRGGRQDQEQ